MTVPKTENPSVVRAWLHDLKRRRFSGKGFFTTIGLIGSIVGAIASLTGIIVAGIASSEIKKPESAKARLEELDRIRTSLAELDRYIEAQKKSITTTETALEELRHQNSELDRVVAIKRETAEALLRYQERRQAKASWIAYTLSYVLGVFSSLTATFIVAFRRRTHSSHNSPSSGT